MFLEHGLIIYVDMVFDQLGKKRKKCQWLSAAVHHQPRQTRFSPCGHLPLKH